MSNVAEKYSKSSVNFSSVCWAFLVWLFACCSVNVTLQAQEQAPQKRFALTSGEMGVALNIVVYADDAEQATRAIAAAVRVVRECNQVFSDYDETSEVAKVSAKEGGEYELSERFVELLVRSAEIHQATDGKFDVTLGPLTRQWRSIRESKKMPEPHLLEETLASCGFSKLQFDTVTRRVTVPAGMQFDFGGIAKGYAADLALKEMAEAGCPIGLVDLGGDVAVGDAPPGNAGWKIAVAPLHKSDQLARFIEIDNAGVATSGDTEQFVTIDGVRYSHILDPSTGLGVQRRASVTVRSENAATADAMASAYSVMSPTEAKNDADSKAGTEVLIQYRVVDEVENREIERVEELRSNEFPEVKQLEPKN